MAEDNVVKTDVLVVGGGAAGVRAAIEADVEGADVVIVSKGPLARSGSTPLAYPTFQASAGFMDARDCPAVHYQDIVAEGKGLSDMDLARALADEAVDRYHDLERYGVRFETEEGRILQSHYPGQTYPRNLLIVGGGFGMVSGLRNELRRHPRAKVMEDVVISRLLLDDGEVAGAVGLNLRDGRFYAFQAKAVVLAGGGYEALWENMDASRDCTGDAITLAFEAGADVIDLEMTMYYPGVFAYPESLKGLLVQYETILGKQYFDFRLVNNLGEEFLKGPLPGRDVLMRAIYAEIEEGRGTEHNAVYVDPRRSSKSPEEIEKMVKRFVEGPDKLWRKLGIDIRKDPFEICPAMHYTLGGIRIDEKTRTSLPGLFAAGENSGNVHGANRIGGNALAETQVFGARGGKYAALYAKKRREGRLSEAEIKEEISRLDGIKEKKKGGIRPLAVRDGLRKLMDRYVGPNRNEEGLKTALGKIVDLKQNGLPRLQAVGRRIFNSDWSMAIEVSGMLVLAELIVRSAIQRKESRGHHYRSDFPESLPDARHTLVRMKNGKVRVGHADVTRLG
jgi:fumarate reductase (CoM/CoB) subunit A